MTDLTDADTDITATTTLRAVHESAMIETVMGINEVLERRSRVLWALYRLKEYAALLDEGMIQWMQANEVPEIEIGEKVLTLTRERAVKRRTANALPIWKAVMTATDGDLDAALNCLSSDAMKQGSVKKLLGEAAWKRFFAVEYQDRIKLSERPKELMQ